MREILFKAKERHSHKWVEGYYVKRENMTFIYPAIPEVVSRSLAKEIRPNHSVKSTQKKIKEVFLVDPETVCQYTGLTDKNGKKIFEGDIVRRETAYYGKHNVYAEPVVWEDDIENDSFGEPYTSGYCIHGGNWEVIGSIHDGEGGQHEGAEHD